jgi:hypothetical protein
MDIRIRTAVHADAPGLFAVKQQLRMPASEDETKQGGFLLGTTLEQYEYFITHDDVLVAENMDAREIVGFSIILRHESIIHSELWQKAEESRWDEGFLDILKTDARYAFYEQLAFLPDPAYRVYAKYLSFAGVVHIFDDHTSLFTTVVRYPIHNTASLPFIELVGFKFVGTHEENYPEYGRIVSDIYHLPKEVFIAKAHENGLASFAARAYKKGYIDHIP